MKPIPAIDEDGDFVEATLEGIAGERIRIVWICGAEVAAYKVVPIREDDFAVFYLDPDDIKDWPAVRERVERAREERENALQYAANVIQQDIAAQHGVCGRPGKPSFAEALEREVNVYEPTMVSTGDLKRIIKRARAASGE